MAIKGYRNKALKRLAHEADRRGVPAASAARIREILFALDGPDPLDTLSAPTYRLHRLKGDRKGHYAVSVTRNRRITFRFDGEHAYDVDLIDYH